jgi:hypothetical protein
VPGKIKIHFKSQHTDMVGKHVIILCCFTRQAEKIQVFKQSKATVSYCKRRVSSEQDNSDER